MCGEVESGLTSLTAGGKASGATFKKLLYQFYLMFSVLLLLVQIVIEQLTWRENILIKRNYLPDKVKNY